MRSRLRQRYESAVSALPRVGLRPGSALRRAISRGYGWGDLRDDVLAGTVVAFVAMPMSMALAIATGVRPEAGLYTAIVAGFVIALLGGSKVQVSGPTAAFVVVLAPITAAHGPAGLAVATLMAGVMLCLMGVLRLGRLIEFVPYPVTTGFTLGIAVVIATLQVKDFLGLGPLKLPEQYYEKVVVLVEGVGAKFSGQPFSGLMLSDALIGLMTLGVLLGWPRVTRRVPAALVALPLAALVAWVLSRGVEGFSVHTLRSFFGMPTAPSGVPGGVPMPAWPWGLGGAAREGSAGVFVLNVETVRSLLGPALAIAMLGAIESLLSAVVADGMTGKKHDPDAELFAQGVGNLAAPFFGGFAAAGAIAPTTTNIRGGAKSPIASMVHAVLMLVFMVALAPALGELPIAAFSAMLLLTARRMADVKQLVFILRYAPRSDVAVLGACFVLTVLFDMVIAVGAGMVLAAVLFVRRMAEVSTVKLVGAEHPAFSQPVPRGVVLYDLGGPLFFGAASRAISAMELSREELRVLVLDMADVPTIDATGLVTLDALISKLNARGVGVVLAGVSAQPLGVMERAGWLDGQEKLAVAGSVEAGVEIARAWVEG